MVTDFSYGFFSDMTGNRFWWIVGPLVSKKNLSSNHVTLLIAVLHHRDWFLDPDGLARG